MGQTFATRLIDILFQTWFFTDSEDPEVLRKTNGHLINTNCSDSHSRTALSCKMGAEFDFFLRSYKR